MKSELLGQGLSRAHRSAHPMKRSPLLLLGVLLMCALSTGLARGEARPAAGPLRVSKENHRYFAAPSGKIVYFAGAHTWPNLRDMGHSDPPKPFDWPGYLDFLTERHHNFIRLWSWDLSRHVDASGEAIYTSPFPWPRTGPETALDGKPKFDLSRFEQSYFDRLRDRVKSAGQRGIYVSIMLFEGWGVQRVREAWAGHPFNLANNNNGVDGDPDRTDKGLAVNTLQVPAVTRVQEAYVRRVIDAVSDLDNVLYEIANEAGPYSTEWQYHMIRFVKQYEAGNPKQHPVGMTFQHQGGSNQALFDSPADWISPNPQASGGYSYRENPPPADGRKVILSDTDHLWGIGGSQAWVWKSFCRGMNPLFMDPYLHDTFYTRPMPGLDPKWHPVRDSLGHTRQFAERMDLAKATPSEEIASSGYCLVVPGKEYLVYLPEGGSVTVDLSAASGQMAVEWFDASRAATHPAGMASGGAEVTFRAPFIGDAVLYLERR